MQFLRKNELARILLIAGLVFVSVFVFMESRQNAWTARTTFLVLAERDNESLESSRISAQNIVEILRSDRFRDVLHAHLNKELQSDIQYELFADITRGSTVEVLVQTRGGDAFDVKKIHTRSIETMYLVSAKYYDMTKDIRIKMLDAAVITKTRAALFVLIVSFLVTIVVTILFEFSIRHFAFANRIRGVIPEVITKDTRWWKENLEKDTKNISNTLSHEEPKTEIKETSKKMIKSDVAQKSVAQKMGFAPNNLPVATVENLEYLKPATKKEEKTPSKEKKQSILSEEKFQRSGIDCEPTEEEMKERLNRLLRGKM